MKKFKCGIFLFHRDLRLFDNVGLINACEQCEVVFPLFILDPKQSDPAQNKFFNPLLKDALLLALQDLDESLSLYSSNLRVEEGDTLEILEKIYQEISPDAFFANADYTLFARTRDEKIQHWGERRKVPSFFCHDYCLNIPGTIVKKDNTPYQVFTSFSKACLHSPVQKTKEIPLSAVFFKSSPKKTQSLAQNLFFKITRKNALFFLSNIDKDYQEKRNIPSENGNTTLSIFLKLGLISVREVFWSFFEKHGENSQGILELYWRDFFVHIGWFFPKIFFGHCFHEKYDNFFWENDEKKFEKWTKGETGFPFVDAGIKELLATGFMHNRVRMVVASFLVKNLNIDWRWGELFFAKHLLDYDPLVNNGNWQWCASTGCDSAPYFRVFSPTSQHKRFDPESVYVKKWIPELSKYTTKQLFEIEKISLNDYFPPLVDSKKTAELAKQKFQI